MPRLSLKVGIAKVSLIGKIPLYLMKENKIMHVIGKTFFSGHLDYFLDLIILLARACLVAHMVKRLPAVQEIRVRSLGREDPMEKEMATQSSTLAWKIP